MIDPELKFIEESEERYIRLLLMKEEGSCFVPECQIAKVQRSMQLYYMAHPAYIQRYSTSDDEICIGNIIHKWRDRSYTEEDKYDNTRCYICTVNGYKFITTKLPVVTINFVSTSIGQMYQARDTFENIRSYMEKLSKQVCEVLTDAADYLVCNLRKLNANRVTEHILGQLGDTKTLRKIQNNKRSRQDPLALPKFVRPKRRR